MNKHRHNKVTAAMLIIVLSCVGCTQLIAETPAPTLTPSPGRLMGATATTIATVQPSSPTPVVPPTTTPSLDVTPSPTPTILPTLSPSAETVTSTAAPSIGAEPEASGCLDAPPAARVDSTDLSAIGRTMAPPLETFNHYRFDLILDPGAAIVTGTQTLDFTNRTGMILPDLVFHLYPNLPELGGRLDIDCAAFDGVAVSPLLEDAGWVLRLPFKTPLAAGASTRVTLHFQTTVPRNVAESKWGAFDDEADRLMLASFYPLLAIRVDNGWDTLQPNNWGDFVTSDMALYHARVQYPDGEKLISSGLVTPECSAAVCQASVAAGPQRDFTMALVQGWEQIRREVGGTAVVSSFPSKWRAAGERVLELGVDAMVRYNGAFGNYPYNELDLMPFPAPGGIGGVEYPSLIMIGDSFYQQVQNPRFDMQDVVVHEVAHMWWYDVVGNDVLREPWLDEGLASYTGEYLYTEWLGQDHKLLTERRLARLKELHVDTIPIDQPVKGYADDAAYVAVIYGRAPLFFAALRTELGDEKFFSLLQEYYRQNAFGRATTTSFKQLAEKVAGRSLTDFFKPWFRVEAP